jgi:YegS/Rv2252/BmrU family lipid kinase
MKFLIAFNPVPNRSRKKRLGQLVSYFKQNDVDFDLYPTDASLSQNQHYFANHIGKYTDVVIVGGDGTIHQILNCLPIPCDVRVAIMPAGTGNDFARWVYGKNRNHLQKILHTIHSDKASYIKLGVCQFDQGDTRYFHNVLGFGFDALLSKKLKDKKGLFRSLGYIKEAVRHIPFYKELPVQVCIDNQSYFYENLITTAANHEYFGNGLKIAPDASPKHKELTLVRIEKLPLKVKAKQIWGLFSGNHVKQPFTDYRKIKHQLRIETPGVDIEADGEYIGQGPATIKTVQDAIQIKHL